MLRPQTLLHSSRRLIVFAFLCLLVVFLTACDKASNLTKEVAYVNAPQVYLRDRLSTIYQKKGTVRLGERVYVLDHNRRFSLVRNERGEEGWISDRYLLSSDHYGQFQKLVTDNAKAPIVARGISRTTLNLHLTPGRDTEHLFQLKEGEKVDILKREAVEKPQRSQPVIKKTAEAETPRPAMEDWLLVRNDLARVGWVLARMVDIDVPLDVAQYAEGQRIVSSFVLNEVQDGDNKVKQYLLMLSDNQDGLPYDFNQIRVFTWNVKRHRYETALRERNLDGVFPVTVGTESFGSEGALPIFTLRVKNDQGQIKERKYRLIDTVVRRVASPEELKAEAAERAAKRASQPRKPSQKRRK